MLGHQLIIIAKKSEMNMKIKLVVLCTLCMLTACSRTKESQHSPINTSEITDQGPIVGNGLIGDDLIGFQISTKDSANWLMNARNRSYLSIDKGQSWSIVVDDKFASPVYLDQNGSLIYLNQQRFLRKEITEQRWERVFNSDSLVAFSIVQLSEGNNYYIVNKVNDVSQLYYTKDLPLTGPLKPISRKSYDSLAEEGHLYRMSQLADKSSIKLSTGHLYYFDSMKQQYVKRMNGIQRPQISSIIQSEQKENDLIAIQVIAGAYFLETYYWVYTSNDFGKNWQLTDSCSTLSKLKNLFHDQTNTTEGQKKDSFSINDTLSLVNSYEKGGLMLVNSLKSDSKILIPQKVKNFKELPDINNQLLPGFPTAYAAKIENDSLKLLYGSTAGGCQFISFSVSTND